MSFHQCKNRCHQSSGLAGKPSADDYDDDDGGGHDVIVAAAVHDDLVDVEAGRCIQVHLLLNTNACLVSSLQCTPKLYTAV